MDGLRKSSFGPESIVWRFLALAIALFFVEGVAVLPYYGSGAITGSHNMETRRLDLTGFNRIRLDFIDGQSSNFEADITCGEDYSVSVTLDDNLYSYSKIRVEDKTLVIGLAAPARYDSMSMNVTITLPSLERLDMCTCYAKLDGSNPSEALSIHMDEGSQLWMDHLESQAIDLDLWNYSYIFGGFTSDTAAVNMYGSTAWLWKGACGRLTANLSGSKMTMNELPARDADITVRDGSSASINVTDNLHALLQGKSLLQYYGDPPVVAIRSNPAATVSREQGQSSSP